MKVGAAGCMVSCNLPALHSGIMGGYNVLKSTIPNAPTSVDNLVACLNYTLIT